MKKFILTSMMLGTLLAQEGVEANEETAPKSEVVENSQAKEEARSEARVEENQAHKPQILEAKKKSKSGFILGVELGASGGRGSGYFIAEDLFNAIPFVVVSELEPFLMQARFMLGYQKYFDAKERFGMNIKAKAGVGFLSLKHDGKVGMFNQPPYRDRDDDVAMIASYTTLSAGLEANFLFDFWRRDDQSLGMSVGVGYDFVYGLNSDIRFEHPFAQAIFAPRVNAYMDKNISYSVISPKIGLHYYLGNHQFSGVLSFDKALGDNQNINRTNGNTDILTTKLSGFVSFNLGYAYRF